MRAAALPRARAHLARLPTCLVAAGGDAVVWLRGHVAGATERTDARRYAAELLERGFIRHAVNARGHKRFSPERYYVVGGEPTGRPAALPPAAAAAARGRRSRQSSPADLTEMGARGVGDVFRRGS